MSKPNISTLESSTTLWFYVSSSGKTSQLIIAYPSGICETSYSGAHEEDWKYDWMNHYDLLDDMFNNFEYVGVL